MNIYINMPQLHKLVTDAMTNPLYNEIYDMARKSYILDFENENPVNIYETAFRINQRQNDKEQSSVKKRERDSTGCQFWAFGQLKIFSWVTIYYCSSKSIQLSKMSENDFTYVKDIFIHKKLMFIKYQTYCLAYSKNKIKDEWRNEENNFLSHIIRRMQQKINWRDISFELFALSDGKFFRSLQQCRQKWANYLNPCVKKGSWQLQEDCKLFNLIQIYAHKWASISRQFQGVRTEHMVKNRYNFYIKNWMKKNDKKGSVQFIEGKIINYLKNKAAKKDKNQVMNSKYTLNKHEQSISSSQDECVSQYNIPLMKESVGIEQDSISHLNSMMERVEVYKCEKEEKKTREDDDDDIQIRTEYVGMDYELFSQSYDERIKKESDFLIEEGLLYISPSEIPQGRELFQMQEMNQLVSALGCSHYERIINDQWIMNELEERDNLEWI